MRPGRTLRRAMLATVLAMTSCDGARDRSFRGVTLFELTVDASNDQARELALFVRWGDGRAIVDRPLVSSGDLSRLSLAVVDTPPDALLRDADEGRFALGEILVSAQGRLFGRALDVLLAFSPAGAVGGPIDGALAPGFTLVYPSGPCDAPDVTIHGLGGVVPSLTFAPGDEPFDEGTLFSSPTCKSQLSERLDCRAFAAVRWWCRHDGADPEAWCSPCEPMLFPEGADAAICGAWQAWCETVFSDAVACAGEAAVCRAQEASRASPCDLDCACRKAYDHCAAERAPDACTEHLSKCHQY